VIIGGVGLKAASSHPRHDDAETGSIIVNSRKRL
jgi:hypothetical protein